jgi:DNA-directed RNA polymerase specialized sigma24 family protein
MINQTTSQSDPLLLPFLQAEDAGQAEELLARLLVEQVEPLVKNIVGYKLRVYFRDNDSRCENRDAEDVYGDAILQLLARLAELRGDGEAEGIRNFRSYVAVTAYRACNLYLRRKYPQRYGLKNRLRYFLTHQPGFALWQSDGDEWLAGFAIRENQSAAPDAASDKRLGELRNDSQAFLDRLPRAATDASLPELLKAIFKWTAAPIELDALVSIVADLCNIKDEAAHSESAEVKPLIDKLQDRQAGAAQYFDQRIYLEKLWGEITQLSPRHAAALLLNLKDEQGGSAIDLFLFTGIATVEQIAATIEKSEEWLAEIWNDLPIDDESVAGQLGLARQQVINLRKTARLRLARRMKELGF